jgi:class 3 adenylate cyclase
MEPQIQYARTSDGVAIAYTTIGDGPPVLYCLGHSISMQSMLSETNAGSPTTRELAARTRLTIFDHAGIGASQRDVSDFSLDAQVRAIESVASRLADDRVTLVGATTGSAGAALYAARHPDRVRALACVYPAPPVTDLTAVPIREDWSLARRRMAGHAHPEGTGSYQRWYSNAMRESMTAEVAAAYIEEFARADLKEIYRRIPVPTLFCGPSAGEGRADTLALASLVPDCRVAVVASGGAGAAAAILEFMGVDAAQVNTSPHGESSTPTPSGDTRATAIILFADIVDSTALTERMGDTAFRAKARALDDALRRIISEAGGTTIDGFLSGDGVLATFPAASQAIAGALACGVAGDAQGLPLHLGLHAGDVIREQNNVFGGAVNIASRISALSAPGEVLVSRTVADLARTSAGVAFEDRGEHALKGVADAVRVFAVRPLEPRE